MMVFNFCFRISSIFHWLAVKALSKHFLLCLISQELIHVYLVVIRHIKLLISRVPPYNVGGLITKHSVCMARRYICKDIKKCCIVANIVSRMTSENERYQCGLWLGLAPLLTHISTPTRLVLSPP